VAIPNNSTIPSSHRSVRVTARRDAAIELQPQPDVQGAQGTPDAPTGGADTLQSSQGTGFTSAAIREDEIVIRQQQQRLREIQLARERARNQLLIQQGGQELKDFHQAAQGPYLRRQRSAALERAFDDDVEPVR